MTTVRHARIDPSGRPLRNAGFEAVFALGLIACWIVIVAFVLWTMGEDRANAGPVPSLALGGVGLLCWWLAEIVAGRHQLVWPGSALGIVGPLSAGFALALSTPELRVGPIETRLAIVSATASVCMIPFLFRFRLPGLVSPVMTFALVALFLGLYGTDPERLRELEGFSPRGIVASLMTEPAFAAAFSVLGLAGAVLARRLDLAGDDFGLAAARPLHLIGGGICALMLGRALALLPMPLDILALAAAWAAAWAWALRLNRIAVLFATQLAMAKPLVMSVTDPLGLALDIRDWSFLISAMIVVQLATWPTLHRLARARDWILGPGGRRPPLDRPGILWRYWPYATEEVLDAWARKRAGRAARRRSFLRRWLRISAGEDRKGSDA
jgi:hypothetical protein